MNFQLQDSLSNCPSGPAEMMKGGGMRSTCHGSLLLLFNSSLCGFVRQKHYEEYSLSVSFSLVLALSSTLRCRFTLGE